MNERIMERLEVLEEKIENLKWLVITPVSLGKAGISNALGIIRRSSGTLSKSSTKGTIFENKIRRQWTDDFLKRRD